jgi:hypothetical protein
MPSLISLLYSTLNIMPTGILNGQRKLMCVSNLYCVIFYIPCCVYVVC